MLSGRPSFIDSGWEKGKTTFTPGKAWFDRGSQRVQQVNFSTHVLDFIGIFLKVLPSINNLESRTDRFSTV